MATFEAKFSLGDRVFITTEASYYKTPTIYEVYSITFIGTNVLYLIERVGGTHGYVQSVDESTLSLVQE